MKCMMSFAHFTSQGSAFRVRGPVCQVCVGVANFALTLTDYHAQQLPFCHGLPWQHPWWVLWMLMKQQWLLWMLKEQQALPIAWQTIPATRMIFTCAGRKKRRAARGRTDVEDQPYEDPNMQVSVQSLPACMHYTKCVTACLIERQRACRLLCAVWPYGGYSQRLLQAKPLLVVQGGNCE